MQTRRDVLTIPSTAVQRGPAGVFSYVVTADDRVQMRPLQVGGESGGVTIIEKGLQEGERVTTNNQYRLQAGGRVQATASAGSGSNAP